MNGVVVRRKRNPIRGGPEVEDIVMHKTAMRIKKLCEDQRKKLKVAGASVYESKLYMYQILTYVRRFYG